MGDMQAKNFLVWSWQERFWGCCSEGSHFLELFVCKTFPATNCPVEIAFLFPARDPAGIYAHTSPSHTHPIPHSPCIYTIIHVYIATYSHTHGPLCTHPQTQTLLHIHPLIYTRIHIHECMILNSLTHPSYTTQSHTWCTPLQMHPYMHASCVHIHFIYTHMCAHHMLRHVHTLTHSPMYT